MAKLSLTQSRKEAIVERLAAFDKWLPEDRRIRLQEWFLDFAENELFAAVWTFLYLLAFGGPAYALLAWLFGETYATIGILFLASQFLLALFIYIFFPKSEIEEKIEEILFATDTTLVYIAEDDENVEKRLNGDYS